MTTPSGLPDPTLLEANVVAEAWQTDLHTGLSAAEAARRLARDGANVLRALPTPPAWRQVLAQLHDPLVYLLLAAAAVALAAWVAEGRTGWPADAIVIAVVVVLNAALGWWQQTKADDAVAALAKMTEASAAVLRDGTLQRLPSAALVCGDVLVLSEGEAVGADARLVDATDLRTLEASLTGESEAVQKDADALSAPAALGDRLNMVFKGTSVAQGVGRAVVTATGMHTQVGSVASLLDATADLPTPLQTEVAHIGRVLGIAAVVIAAGVIAAVLLTSPVREPADLVQVLLLGVSLAVAAVPEGLPAILSVVLALGVQRMATRHAIVKNLASVETLGSASIIATDKTGTLTRAEMTIVRVLTASGSGHISGVGYAIAGQVEHAGAAVQPGHLWDEISAVLSGGSLAGNASLQAGPPGDWVIQGDPTEAAFLVAEHKLGGTARRQARFSRIDEIPFTSDRKMMSSIEADHQHANVPVIFSKGAPGVLLAHCTHMRIGADTVALDDAMRARILADVGALADEALRTLAVAYRPLTPDEDLDTHAALEHDLIYLGSVGMIDPPRPEAAVAIRQAHDAGIRVVMITGDHPRTALSIAADLGIVSHNDTAGSHTKALTGTQLDALDDAAFTAAMRHTSVFARVAPHHKLRIIHALQADGEVVSMTGDGVNDAPALKAADIGVAMGITGTEVTKQAARMILADDNFATIVDAVREGRGVLDNIRKFLRYLLPSNLGEVLTVFLGVIGASVIGLNTGDGLAAGSAMVLPLLATQILWVNLITDAGPALAMGLEPVADDVMTRKPRRRDARMIDGAMWTRIVTTGVTMALVTLLTIDLFLPGGLIEGHESLTLARTAGFTVLVLAQLFNCFNARSETASVLRGLFSNPWLWGAVLLSALLQVAVVHVPFLNQAFGTAPMSLNQWLVCAAMASVVLWLSELQKLVRRVLLHRPRS